MIQVSDDVLGRAAEAERGEAGATSLVAHAVHSMPMVKVPSRLSTLEEAFWRERWTEHHPPQPKPNPEVLGPFNARIAVGNGVPVGGWTQVSLHEDGSWNFGGHLRDSGGAGCDVAVVWAVRNRGTGEVFVLTHAGSVAGSCEPGPRDDDWFDAGASQTIADGWAGFIAGGYSWAMRAGANLDTGSLVSAATTAVGATATVISLR